MIAKTAVALFEQRLAVSGWRNGTGAEVAAAVCRAADGTSDIGMRRLLDCLASGLPK